MLRDLDIRGRSLANVLLQRILAYYVVRDVN
jgi:hypothetical protein